MRQSNIIAGIVVFIAGVSLGYVVSLSSSIKKSHDVVASVPAAMDQMDDYSDLAMAQIIRVYQKGLEKKQLPHEDASLNRYLSDYYKQRSSLPPSEQEALGASAILPFIKKLAEASPDLKSELQSTTSH